MKNTHSQHTMDTRKSSAYCKTLVDPANFVTDIPDMDMTSCIKKSVTLTKNVVVPSPPNSGEVLLVWTPENKIAPLRIFVWLAASSKYVYFTQVPTDQNLSQSYTRARLISSLFKVDSSTVSSTVSSISGTINGIAFQEIPDVGTLSYTKLMPYVRDGKSLVVNQSVSEGTVALSQPTGSQPFVVLDTANAYSTDSSLVISTTPDTDPSAWVVTPIALTVGPTFLIFNSDLATVFPLPGNVFGFVSGDLILAFSSTAAASLTFSVLVIRDQIDATWSVVSQATATTSFDFTTGAALTTQSIAFKIPPIQINYLSRIQVVVQTTAAVTIQVVNNHSFSALTLEFPNYYFNGVNSPGVLQAIQGLGAAQVLSMGGILNYEAIPDATLAQDIATQGPNADFSFPFELEMVQKFLSSPMSGWKLLWAAYEYDRFLTGQVREIIDLKTIATASGFGDFFNFLKPLLPIVGGVIGGPSGAAIGSTIASLPLGNSSTHHHNRSRLTLPGSTTVYQGSSSDYDMGKAVMQKASGKSAVYVGRNEPYARSAVYNGGNSLFGRGGSSGWGEQIPEDFKVVGKNSEALLLGYDKEELKEGIEQPGKFSSMKDAERELEGQAREKGRRGKCSGYKGEGRISEARNCAVCFTVYKQRGFGVCCSEPCSEVFSRRQKNCSRRFLVEEARLNAVKIQKEQEEREAKKMKELEEREEAVYRSFQLAVIRELEYEKMGFSKCFPKEEDESPLQFTLLVIHKGKTGKPTEKDFSIWEKRGKSSSWKRNAPAPRTEPELRPLYPDDFPISPGLKCANSACKKFSRFCGIFCSPECREHALMVYEPTDTNPFTDVIIKSGRMELAPSNVCNYRTNNHNGFSQNERGSSALLFEEDLMKSIYTPIRTHETIKAYTGEQSAMNPKKVRDGIFMSQLKAMLKQEDYSEAANSFPVVYDGKVLEGFIFLTREALHFTNEKVNFYHSFSVEGQAHPVFVSFQNHEQSMDDEMELPDEKRGIAYALSLSNLDGPMYMTFYCDVPFDGFSYMAALNATLAGITLSLPISGAYDVAGTGLFPKDVEIKALAFPELYVTGAPADLALAAQQPGGPPVNRLMGLLSERIILIGNATVTSELRCPMASKETIEALRFLFLTKQANSRPSLEFLLTELAKMDINSVQIMNKEGEVNEIALSPLLEFWLEEAPGYDRTRFANQIDVGEMKLVNELPEAISRKLDVKVLNILKSLNSLKEIIGVPASVKKKGKKKKAELSEAPDFFMWGPEGEEEIPYTAEEVKEEADKLTSNKKLLITNKAQVEKVKSDLAVFLKLSDSMNSIDEPKLKNEAIAKWAGLGGRLMKSILNMQMKLDEMEEAAKRKKEREAKQKQPQKQTTVGRNASKANANRSKNEEKEEMARTAKSTKLSRKAAEQVLEEEEEEPF